MYIQAASSITTLDTFSTTGFWEQLLSNGHTQDSLLEPEYKQYIPAGLLRRTPKINRMALACLEKCLNTYPAVLDGIVIGTGLGCLQDTQKFLEQIATAKEGQLLSPTAFIQSGHNAIAGQIALNKKIHDYNMTHVQRGLSFEYALKDALLCLEEGHQEIFVGAVDEKTELLSELAAKFGIDEQEGSLSEGGSFFIVNQKPSAVKILDVQICGSDWKEALDQTLKELGLESRDLDHAFVGYNGHKDDNVNLDCPSATYTEVCGRYFSSSAFGLHAAYDFLSTMAGAKHALVVNRADQNQTSLMLLCRE
ncbi:MAG: beta-ketoacyl synthase chain length factor [Reichenbachiella sp.]|uniref:beta-ketoacyl synthase chain length factor n=1 Tax=Reichenbachiella sp. TaxID=2184521 RepID=UPI003263BC3D